tara:strand:+ start:3576 stop:3893 length:318 start_codon:yes stop_codon:yes gene_type:complete
LYAFVDELTCKINISPFIKDHRDLRQPVTRQRTRFLQVGQARHDRFYRSQQTAAILKQNIILALGIKALFLAITLTGQATMWMAVFADMGVSLLVVFNGLRLLKK